MKHSSIFYLLMISLLQTSCTKDVQEVLCDRHHCYWYYVNNKSNIPMYFVFYQNGILEVKEQNDRGLLLDYEGIIDEPWDQHWSMKSDSIVYVGFNHKNCIVTQENDSIIILKTDSQQIVLHAVKDIHQYSYDVHIKYINRLDSILRIHYDLYITKIRPTQNKTLISGFTPNGTQTSVELTNQEIRILNPKLGDRLLKNEHVILMNKFSADSVFLYNYMVNDRFCELVSGQSGTSRDFCRRYRGAYIK